MRIQNCRLFAFLDPATGTSLTGDYAAIVTLARDTSGTLHLLDLWMDRVPLAQQVARAFDLLQRYPYTLFGIETNNVQGTITDYVRAEQKARIAQGQTRQLPVKYVRHNLPKHNRILSLEPRIVSGNILFNRHLPEPFFHQADEYPHAHHDDALDALEGAVTLATAQTPIIIHTTGPRITHEASRYF
ncbi:MAG: phage terminase large subunit [Candidatus Sumerlaeaceae bacterium]|nr:phage terminase large subunit [Candidatus Sumerlaeaceae bacterium]